MPVNYPNKMGIHHRYLGTLSRISVPVRHLCFPCPIHMCHMPKCHILSSRVMFGWIPSKGKNHHYHLAMIWQIECHFWSNFAQEEGFESHPIQFWDFQIGLWSIQHLAIPQVQAIGHEICLQHRSDAHPGLYLPLVTTPYQYLGVRHGWNWGG